MKHICTILLAAALIIGSGRTAQAQSIPEGTYVYNGMASNMQPYTITAVITAGGLSFTENVQADVLCTSTMHLESVLDGGTTFIYKANALGAGDCTLGQDFVFTLTPVVTTISFRKSEGSTVNLVLQ